MIKITEHSLDLTGCDYRSYTEEEKGNFKRVLEGYESPALQLLKSLAQKPDIIRLKGIDYNRLVQLAEEANEFAQVIRWIEEKKEKFKDSLRHRNSLIREDLDKVIDVARTLADRDEEIAAIFAVMFDFLSEPAKKKKATEKKKKDSQSRTAPTPNDTPKS